MPDALGEGAGAAAARSRLARSSAPVPQHQRTVSWGGWDTVYSSTSGAALESPQMTLQPLGGGGGAASASLGRMAWPEVAAAAVEAVGGGGGESQHDTRQQQQQWGDEEQEAAQHLESPQQQNQLQQDQQQQWRVSHPLPPRSDSGRFSAFSLPTLHEHPSVGQQASVSDEWPGAHAATPSSATATDAGTPAGAAAADRAADVVAETTDAAAAAQPEPSSRDSPEPLRSVLVVAGQGAHAVEHGAAALASAVAAGFAHLPTPTGLLAAQALGAHKESVQLARQDAEYEREMEQLAPALAPQQSDEDDGTVPPMQRLSTQEALSLLSRATEARECEEAARRAAAASLAAAAASVSAGGALGSPGGPGGGDAAAAVQSALLAELLAEMQALRKDVDGIRRHST